MSTGAGPGPQNPTWCPNCPAVFQTALCRPASQPGCPCPCPSPAAEAQARPRRRTFRAGGKGVQQLRIGQVRRLGGGGKHVYGVGVCLQLLGVWPRQLAGRRPRRRCRQWRRAAAAGGAPGATICGRGAAASRCICGLLRCRRRCRCRRRVAGQRREPFCQRVDSHAAHAWQLGQGSQRLSPALQQLASQQAQVGQALVRGRGRAVAIADMRAGRRR